MFMDASAPGGPGGEPHAPRCHGCRQAIAPNDAQTEIRFGSGDGDGLVDLNGRYHEACARPILNVKRAYDMLKRPQGF